MVSIWTQSGGDGFNIDASMDGCGAHLPMPPTVSSGTSTAMSTRSKLGLAGGGAAEGAVFFAAGFRFFGCAADASMIVWTDAEVTVWQGWMQQ